MISRLFILFTLIGLFSFSCGSDDEASQDSEAIDEQNLVQIRNFIEDNNLPADSLYIENLDAKLFYVIENEGNATKPTVQDTVTVDYRGYFFDGSDFDSSYSRGTPATLPLSNVILGWQIGIPLFGEGGKGTLILPSKLAYGRSGIGSIPPNAVIAFDVELHRVIRL